ncbi:MAG: type I-MYXAN CRISPR-associated protein Cas6/Cmx6, partial [Burkholderiales bacterium]
MFPELETCVEGSDLRFELRGERLPLDHGQALAEAVSEHLPWLADEPAAGIHAVRGAAMSGGLL